MPGNNIPLTKSGKPDKRYKKPLPILPEVIPDPETKEITNIKDLPRFDQFVINTFYLPTKEAAIEAGYAITTAETEAYEMIHQDRFQKKCQEYWPKDARNNLPIQARIKRSVLNYCLDNPGIVPNFRQILKEDREEAGVRDSLIPAPRTINLGDQINIGVMIKKEISQSVSSNDDDVIDVEKV